MLYLLSGYISKIYKGYFFPKYMTDKNEYHRHPANSQDSRKGLARLMGPKDVIQDCDSCGTPKVHFSYRGVQKGYKFKDGHTIEGLHLGNCTVCDSTKVVTGSHLGEIPYDLEE